MNADPVRRPVNSVHSACIGTAKLEYILTLGVILFATLASLTLFGRRLFLAWRRAAMLIPPASSNAPRGPELRPVPIAVPTTPTRHTPGRTDDYVVNPDWMIGTDEVGPFGGGEHLHGKARVPDARPVFRPKTDAQGHRQDRWSGRDIVTDMTQFDENAQTRWDAVRCVMASSLASRIMGGQPYVQHLILDLLGRAEAILDPGPRAKTFDPKTLIPNYVRQGDQIRVGTLSGEEYLKRIKIVEERFGKGILTHGDLGMLQEVMFEAYGTVTDADRGTSLKRAANVMELCNGVDPKGADIDSPTGPTSNNTWNRRTRDGLLAELRGLPPGGTVIVEVQSGDAGGAHDVLMGRDAQGRIYLYDPFPENTLYGRENVPQLLAPDPGDDASDLFHLKLRSYDDGSNEAAYTVHSPVVYSGK